MGVDTSDDEEEDEGEDEEEDEEEVAAPKPKKQKKAPAAAKKAAPKAKAKAAAKGKGKGKAAAADGPKRPTSAYIYFTTANRERLKAENPEVTKKLGDLAKLFGAEWKELTDAGKKQYNALAAKDKARYEKEKKGWKGKKGGKAKPAKKSTKNADGSDKKPNMGGFNQPLVLSAELSAVCGGTGILSRAECMKQIWVYIKANELQKPTDKRTILCDGALLKITGGEKEVLGFSLSKYLSGHLTKPTGASGAP